MKIRSYNRHTLTELHQRCECYFWCPHPSCGAPQKRFYRSAGYAEIRTVLLFLNIQLEPWKVSHYAGALSSTANKRPKGPPNNHMSSAMSEGVCKNWIIYLFLIKGWPQQSCLSRTYHQQCIHYRRQYRPEYVQIISHLLVLQYSRSTSLDHFIAHTAGSSILPLSWNWHGIGRRIRITINDITR